MANNAMIIENEAGKTIFDTDLDIMGDRGFDRFQWLTLTPDVAKIQIFQSYFVKILMLWLSKRKKAVILAGHAALACLDFSNE